MGEFNKPDTSEQPLPEQRGRRHSIARIVKRSLLVVAVVLLALILYVLWFMAGKPEPTVDYIAMLNDMMRPEGLSPENNAWPLYEEAVQRYVPPTSGLFGGGLSLYRRPWFDDFNEPDQRALRQWIADNEAAWQLFAQATEKPCCWKEYKRVEGPPATDVLDVPTLQLDRYPMGRLRMLVFLGAYRIRGEVYEGQTAAALRDCLILIQAGVRWNQMSSFRDSLLSRGMATAAHQELLKVLFRAPADQIDWEWLQASLRDVYGPEPLEFHMELQKLRDFDIVQHVFTRGGMGGGHLIPRYIWPLIRMRSVVITIGSLPEKPSWRRRGLYLAMALAHARRDATISQCKVHHDQITQILALTPYELSHCETPFVGERLHMLNYKIHFNSFFRDARYFALGFSKGLAMQISERQWQLQALHEATGAVLAIKRWQSERGQYPETLGQLVRGGFLESLPLDPYSDKALLYRQTDDGFTLYSRGCNQMDDSGESLFDPNCPSTMWGTDEGGDAIFWPVQ